MVLYPQGDWYTPETIEDSSNGDLAELSNKDSSIPLAYYLTWNPDENERDVKGDHASLRLDDFFIFNFTLLSVLPPLLPLTVQVYVLIGHIIAVQIGQEATYQLGRLFKQWRQPCCSFTYRCSLTVLYSTQYVDRELEFIHQNLISIKDQTENHSSFCDNH